MKHTKQNMSETDFEASYLHYVNDFLTVKRFAEYYNISIRRANQIIKIGRLINHNR